jgi:hypothetical protein
LGYNENSKAYRIYVLGQRQIEVSRDVISMRKSHSRNPESYNKNQKQFNQLHPLLKVKSQMIRGRNLMKGQVMSPC